VSKLPGLPPGSRAAQLPDSNVELPGAFLALFGKPARESACECERSGGLMLGPVLSLVNGPLVADALRDPNNRLYQLTANEPDDARVVEEIFVAALSRLPTQRERALGLKALAGGRDEHNLVLKEYNRRLTAVADREKALDVKQAEWEKTLKAGTAWSVFDPAALASSGGATLTKQPDGSILLSGKNPSPDVYTFTATTKEKGITAVRLEVLPDASLAAMGPGRAPNGNFVLNEFKVTAAPAGDPTKAKPVALHKAQADFSQEAWAVAGAIDGNPTSGWAVAPQFGKAHVAVFELKEPLGFDEGTTLTFTLDQQFPGKDHNIGKFRLSVTTAAGPIQLQGPPENVAKVVAVEPGKRTKEQQAELANYFRSQDAELARLKAEVAAFGQPGDPRVLGAQDLMWALLNTNEFMFNH